MAILYDNIQPVFRKSVVKINIPTEPIEFVHGRLRTYHLSENNEVEFRTKKINTD